MCGIVGLIDRTLAAFPTALLDAMRDTMIARGPDGSGRFVEGSVGLAMRRLSIIDLEHGGQPLTSRSGRVVAFQNGEIYNYRELRRELGAAGYRFLTASDTEVLAHGYDAWGMSGLLSRIDGMFAIAILDRDTRTLQLARDGFGEKPLFYVQGHGRFAFASNLLALAALPWVDASPDPASLDRYLALHFVPGARTVFKGADRVLPGERLEVRIDDPVPQRHRWFRPALEPAPERGDEELAGTLEEAIRSRLVADVPVGVFLSGGLDSSVIAAVAARSVPRIATFSIGFSSKEHDESAHAKRVAAQIGSDHHHFLFDELRFRDLLPEVVGALDEPLGDQAMLPLFWLCREARRHVKVALSGEGADELFAGYGYYARFAPGLGVAQIARALIRPQPSPLNRLAHNAEPVTPSGFPLLADAAERALLLGGLPPGPDEWERDFIGWLDGARDPLQRATAADIGSWLPDDLLVKLDRMAMANSLEGRAPYLHPGLARLALCGLSADQRMSGGSSKVALRRLASRWLPAEIVERGKQGFVLPMRTWLSGWIEQAGGVRAYLAQRHLPGIDMTYLAQAIERDVSRGVERERFLFAVIALLEWYSSATRTIVDLKALYARS